MLPHLSHWPLQSRHGALSESTTVLYPLYPATGLNVGTVPKQGQWYLHIDTKTKKTFPFGLISQHTSFPLDENKATEARPRARNRKRPSFSILTPNVAVL